MKNLQGKFIKTVIKQTIISIGDPDDCIEGDNKHSMEEMLFQAVLTPEQAYELQNEEMGQPDFFMIEGFNA